MQVKYTDLIHKVISIIKNEYKLTVEINYELFDKEEISGRILYNEKLIILCDPNAKFALMTLCHEIGHWISYLRYYNKINNPTEEQRERWAYLFGWYFIRKYSLDKYITKTEWKEFHDY